MDSDCWAPSVHLLGRLSLVLFLLLFALLGGRSPVSLCPLTAPGQGRRVRFPIPVQVLLALGIVVVLG